MKALKDLRQNELVKLVEAMAKLSKDNELLMSVATQGSELSRELIADYERRIVEILDAYTTEVITSSAAFEKINSLLDSLALLSDDKVGVAKVLVYAATKCNDLAAELGGVEDAYYDSMCELFDRSAEFVSKLEKGQSQDLMIDLSDIVIAAENIDLSYFQFISVSYKDLFGKMPEDL